jgi:hypothetical protein
MTRWILLALIPMSTLAEPPDAYVTFEPPDEAYAACTGLGTAAACTVRTPAGALEGACDPDAHGALFCRPAGPQVIGLPPEAIEACRERTQGAFCTVQLPGDGTLSGHCRDDAIAGQLCVPDAPPSGW